MSETCRVLYQNSVEKYYISLAFIIRIYHDARCYECQMLRVFLLSAVPIGVLNSTISIIYYC